MKNLNGLRIEISEHINKINNTYKDKFVTKTGQFKIVNKLISNDKILPPRRFLIRAPSIATSKEIAFNKLRNKTIAKININYEPIIFDA
jgi:hypothetical protein